MCIPTGLSGGILYSMDENTTENSDMTQDEDIIKELHRAVEKEDGIEENHETDFETNADGDKLVEDFEHDGKSSE